MIYKSAFPAELLSAKCFSPFLSNFHMWSPLPFPKLLPWPPEVCWVAFKKHQCFLCLISTRLPLHISVFLIPFRFFDTESLVCTLTINTMNCSFFQESSSPAGLLTEAGFLKTLILQDLSSVFYEFIGLRIVKVHLPAPGFLVPRQRHSERTLVRLQRSCVALGQPDAQQGLSALSRWVFPPLPPLYLPWDDHSASWTLRVLEESSSEAGMQT